MNKNRILSILTPYYAFAEHKDLIAFCVPADAFRENFGECDFNELVAVVEKDWLFKRMKEKGIENPLSYLQNEYTGEDGYNWFFEANVINKVALVNFN